MSVFEFIVEESLDFFEDEVQGNKGNHLEYDETLVDGLFFDEMLWFTDISFCDEVLNLSDDFTASHEPYCILSETLLFSEDFCIPARLFNSFVSVLTPPDVSPVELYWFGVDVVHGPDTFYNEVSENLGFDSETRVSNIFVDTVYETFWIDLETPNNLYVPVWVRLYCTSTDIINFRHDLTHEYFFNNIVTEFLYPFDNIFRCFGHTLAEPLSFSDQNSLAHGRVIDEHITIADGCGSNWYGGMDLSDGLTVFDYVLDEKYYDHILEEVIDLLDEFSVTPSFSETVRSVIQISDDVFGSAAYTRIVTDSLALSCASSYKFFVLHEVDDTVAVVDESLLRYTSVALLSDAISFLGENTSSASILALALETLVVYDEPTN